jgi:hypothetical protein
MIEFVTASHDPKVLRDNLDRSPIFQPSAPQFLGGYFSAIGFNNVARAYNTFFPKEETQFVVYVHHDVYLPENFYFNLKSSLLKLEKENWGVLGVAGVKFDGKIRSIHGNIQDRGKRWGCPENLPHEVDTLDELLLVTKGDYIFDEQFPQDFYGADICMQARERGEKVFAIDAYCEHNSGRAVGGRTPSFFESEAKFKEKWKKYLPIVTTTSWIIAD